MIRLVRALAVQSALTEGLLGVPINATSKLQHGLKLAVVFVAGDSHRFTGIVVEVIAYAASLLLIHKLFAIVKPKLMELP